jgi:hypothetical protein
MTVALALAPTIPIVHKVRWFSPFAYTDICVLSETYQQREYRAINKVNKGVVGFGWGQWLDDH